MDQFKHHVTLHQDGTYSMGISINFGYMTPDDLIALGNLAKKYNINCCMATTAKKLSFMDVKEDDVNKVWDELETIFGDRLSFPKGKIVVCPGSEYCKFAAKDYDNHRIAKEVEKISLRHDAGKIKVGVTACPLGCSMPKVKDLGIFATGTGWNVVVGGGAGAAVRTADTIAKDLSDDALLALLDKIYQYFEENKKDKERTARTVNRLGIDDLKAYLGL